MLVYEVCRELKLRHKVCNIFNKKNVITEELVAFSNSKSLANLYRSTENENNDLFIKEVECTEKDYERMISARDSKCIQLYRLDNGDDFIVLRKCDKNKLPKGVVFIDKA